MNQSQRNYAVARINAIKDRLIAEATAANTIAAVRLTPQQRRDMILKGTITVRKDLSVSDVRGYVSDISQIFDFTPHERGETVNQVKLKPIVARITKKAQACCDAVQLGDDAAALKAIADMEKAG